jgi:hypothetical protein
MYLYEIRTASGSICCGGNEIDFPRCDKCKTKRATRGRRATPAQAARALVRARAEIDEAERLRVLKAPVVPPAIPDPRALDATDYSAPDPYAAELQVWRDEHETADQKWEREYKEQWSAELEAERNNPLPTPPARPKVDGNYDAPNPYGDL